MLVFFLNRPRNLKFNHLLLINSYTSRYIIGFQPLSSFLNFIFTQKYRLFTICGIKAYRLRFLLCTIFIGTCLGTSAQDLYWENFDLPSGTTIDNGPTAWSRDISNTNLGPQGRFETIVVNNFKVFYGVDLDGEAIWLSEVLDISTLSSAMASVDIIEFGRMEGNDYLRLFYKLDGGPETSFGDFRNDFGASFQTIFSPALSGTSLQIIIRVKNNQTNEYHAFDNIRVFDSANGGPTLYSRRNRNWNNRLAWSTSGLEGPSCFCTPDANTNVVIGSNHTIRLNTDGTARGLTIQNAGALNSNGAHNLFIAGDFNITSSNSDALNIGSQTVTFNGSGDQIVALNGESLFDVVVNKPNGKVTLTQPINLLNQLVLRSATEFDSNGHLRLISTSDGTSGNAMIGVIPDGGIVSGDVTVQRYISGEGNIWRYISSPVTNATVADWQDDFPITGKFTDPSTGPGINPSNPSLYYYGETGSGGNLLLGWTAFPMSGTAASNTLIPGAGYTALMLDGSNPTLVEVSGPINQGVFSFNVSFAGSGWNLLGNPYPATIDWSATNGWSSSNVANAIYIRNNENGNSNSTVASYVDGIGTNGGTGLVATGQSFWVQAIGSNPTLQINERAKSNTTGIFFRKAETDNWFRITLSNQSQSDEAVIRLSKRATNGYDPKMDAKKFNNGGINISTFIESEVPMAINSLPVSLCAEQISIKLNKTDPGIYQIKFTELAGFNPPFSISLIDSYADSTVMVVDSTVYAFSIDDSSASHAARFKLLMNPEVKISRQGIDTLWSNYTDGNQWFLHGQLIPGESSSFLILNEPGIYGLEVSNLQCSQYDEIQILTTDLLAQPPVFITYPNPVIDYLNIDFATTSGKKAELYIYNMLGKLQFSNPLEISHQGNAQINFSKIEPGIYLVKMIVDDKSYSIKIVKSP